MTADRVCAADARVCVQCLCRCSHATGKLLAWCGTAGYPAIAWTDLAEVADWLVDALADGRLPARAEEVPAWREKHRDPARPPFVCGPEVWGVGRTVPPGRAEGAVSAV